MPEHEQQRRSWVSKFSDAFRGVCTGIRGERSFRVHLPVGLAVLLLAGLLRLDRTDWALLLLAITAVMVAEMLNSALECLGRAVDPRPNPLLGKALDMASGAVLLSAVGAASVGLVVFVPALLRVLAAAALE